MCVCTTLTPLLPPHSLVPLSTTLTPLSPPRPTHPPLTPTPNPPPPQSGLVIHMLGSSSVLMPLFNLMAVIVVAGGTLDDAGMLAEAGGSQGAESLTVERAVARVAKAIRLLGRATRNGRGVVARLMREARTDRVRDGGGSGWEWSGSGVGRSMGCDWLHE